jgi:protein phosphatase
MKDPRQTIPSGTGAMRSTFPTRQLPKHGAVTETWRLQFPSRADSGAGILIVLNQVSTCNRILAASLWPIVRGECILISIALVGVPRNLEHVVMVNAFDMDTTEYELVISPSARDSRSRSSQHNSSPILVEFGAITHPGKDMSHNEDHFLVSRLSGTRAVLATNISDHAFSGLICEDEAYSLIVADGMGGKDVGNVASQIAIGAGLKLLANLRQRSDRIKKRGARKLFEHVNDCLREIDISFTERNEDEGKLIGMGSTLTAAYIIGADLFIIHLGDSRAYLHRDRQLRQLTKDHTVAQAMADSGYFASADVGGHTKSGVLTNFLGGHHGKVKVDVSWLRVRKDDRLLLCSDGLTDIVDDESLGGILGEHPRPCDAAQHLLDAALAGGGKDDITIIVACYAV